jgi:DNA-binding CsgD family transcriptional regulator
MTSRGPAPGGATGATGDSGVADWLMDVGVPAWLVDPGGRLALVNSRAERLLGRDRESCLGKPCHLIVRGLNEAGRPLCEGGCCIRERARAGQAVVPTKVQIPQVGGEPRWVWILVVPLHIPGGCGPWIAHLVLDANRSHRFETYLLSALGKPGPQPIKVSVLSPREAEVLRLLSKNESQKRIAVSLSVSYVTVRNHVQHILQKLDVHSIQEAVALHLLSADSQAGDDSTP